MARCVAEWGITQSVNVSESNNGGIALSIGSTKPMEKVSCNMAYPSERIAQRRGPILRKAPTS